MALYALHVPHHEYEHLGVIAYEDHFSQSGLRIINGPKRLAPNLCNF